MQSPRAGNRWVYVALVVLIAVGGVLGFRVYQQQQLETPTVVAQPPVVAAPSIETPPAMNLADGDALLKAHGVGLSNDPLLAQWLAQPDLIRRLVGAVAQVASGESPRTMLAFLGPEAGFSVVEKGGKTFMGPTSTGRYDAVARAIGSVDAAKLGALYGTLRPYAQSAFREVAPKGKTFDAAFLLAVDQLAAVPLTDAPLEVAPLEKIVGFRFVDDSLEGLSAAQKHLLRMGPANARIIVGKLQAFRSAFDGGKHSDRTVP